MKTPETYIEETVKEFDRLCQTDINQGGWTIPYEGILENKASDFLRQALTQALAKGKQVGVEEARVIKEIGEKVDKLPRVEFVSDDKDDGEMLNAIDLDDIKAILLAVTDETL